MKIILFKLLRILGFGFFGLFLLTSIILVFQKEYGAGIFASLISSAIYYFTIYKTNAYVKSTTEIYTPQYSEEDAILQLQKSEAEAEHMRKFKNIEEVLLAKEKQLEELRLEEESIKQRLASSTEMLKNTANNADLLNSNKEANLALISIEPLVKEVSYFEALEKDPFNISTTRPSDVLPPSTVPKRNEIITPQNLLTKNKINEKRDNINIMHSKIFTYEKFKIPEPIFELLWFGDGKHKNTTVENEPSLVKKASVREGLAEPIGYYPSYENLNPGQKFKYLNWLTDITKPIDIGYVFIFYYGLERHIIEGKKEKAVNMIRALKKIFSNGSFQAYSNDALLLATMLDNNLKYLDGINLDTNPLQTLSVKYITAGACDAIDIVNASSKIGFTNKRYIKSHPTDFVNTLNTLLTRQYGQDKYMFSIEDPSLLKSNAAILANYSFSLDIRFFGFIDVLQDSKTQQDLYNLLFITHEHIKELLKERRKMTNQKVKENLELPRIE